MNIPLLLFLWDALIKIIELLFAPLLVGVLGGLLSMLLYDILKKIYPGQYRSISMIVDQFI